MMNDTMQRFAVAPTGVLIKRNSPFETHYSRTCEHVLRARIKQTANGMRRAKMQCIRCGIGVGSSVPSAGVTEAWDHDAEAECQRSYKQAWIDYREQCERDRAGANSEWWDVYSKYLKSEIWRSKRSVVLIRARNLCECCGIHAPAQVHHLEYPKVFGHEPLWTLRAVCMRCHHLLHPDREM